MQSTKERPANGHVLQIKREKGPEWVAEHRLCDGRQVKKAIGPAHTGCGRRPASIYSRASRSSARGRASSAAGPDIIIKTPERRTAMEIEFADKGRDTA